MNALVEFFRGDWGLLILGLGLAGFLLPLLLKIPKSKSTRTSVVALSLTGIILVGLIGYGVPMMYGEGKAPFSDVYTVTMTKDNTAADWADYLGTADADLWADAESDCDNAQHICTVIITATRVGTGINTIAPDEGLIHYKITRDSDNPNIDYEDDYSYPTVRFSYAHAKWTNSTSGDTFDAIYKDADMNYIVYIEQGLTAGGEALVSGQTKVLDGMQPGDSLDYYIGFKLNPVGFGADGQTATVSNLQLTGEIAGYGFTVILNDAAIS